jgi:hypothetical protein
MERDMTHKYQDYGGLRYPQTEISLGTAELRLGGAIGMKEL